ncbi:hypothetical protein TNCV_2592241 [Trichonephila clavipes]|nr:hypothetical protein TNCV_2592241 [Trichonephila clavipes]
MLENVIENWTSRLDYIKASSGRPMPEIIFKIESISDEDFGSEYSLIISESDCSDFGTSKTESDSDSEPLSAARQWYELNTDTPNFAPPEFIFQGDPGLNFRPDNDDFLQLFEYFLMMELYKLYVTKQIVMLLSI